MWSWNSARNLLATGQASRSGRQASPAVAGESLAGGALTGADAKPFLG